LVIIIVSFGGLQSIAAAMASLSLLFIIKSKEFE